ncbi:hypothetical protein RCL_jg20599.t1 [Rhizophagus clarus]|uniref:Uncharacterized protein n=1 Tax=Rhizophagus clarus TaxID=94130 RepID=A0A8H3QNU5_9GLOM|nr:hypothetical protein RCL_jg20599.t1 [Rhizophagus clarus]
MKSDYASMQPPKRPENRDKIISDMCYFMVSCIPNFIEYMAHLSSDCSAGKRKRSCEEKSPSTPPNKIDLHLFFARHASGPSFNKALIRTWILFQRNNLYLDLKFNLKLQVAA